MFYHLKTIRITSSGECIISLKEKCWASKNTTDQNIWLTRAPYSLILQENSLKCVPCADNGAMITVCDTYRKRLTSVTLLNMLSPLRWPHRWSVLVASTALIPKTMLTFVSCGLLLPSSAVVNMESLWIGEQLYFDQVLKKPWEAVTALLKDVGSVGIGGLCSCNF